MNSVERWQEIKDVLYGALQMEPAERSSYLDEKCADDLEMRREVESLIAAHASGERLESPAVETMAAALSSGSADGMLGKALGHYEVIEMLGAGGMGEVYTARDTLLGRRVALKLLPAYFTQDGERVRRFQQEARAASALNHPNIITIYEIGEADSRHYIATEYIEGETLREKIGRGPLKIAEALDVAVQVANALAAAHEGGIAHRDIKPENVMLRRDGIAKVLDFGLAKLSERMVTDSEASTVVRTGEGVVMGTVQYMSPEQARGLKVDVRTDIWSLGCVLYEMLAGRAPFTGPTSSDIIVSILEREPTPLASFRQDLPTELNWLVQKSLRKDADERYQTSKELLSDLRTLKRRFEAGSELVSNAEPNTEPAEPPSATVSALPRGTAEQPIRHPTSSAEYVVTEIKRRKWGVLTTLVLLATAASALVWKLTPFREPNDDGRRAPNVAATFTQLTNQPGPEYFPSLSPDGKSFIYAGFAAGNWDIYLHRVGGRNPINLTQDSFADDSQPSFSPDGESIAFRSERDGGGIFVMGATGESVNRVTDTGFNPTWSPDSKQIAYSDESIVTNPAMRWRATNPVWAVNVSTGEKRLIANEGTQPSWSPNGHRIALCGKLKAGGRRDIHTVSAADGEPVEATSDAAMDWSPVWSPDGNYLYFASDRGGSMNIWRVPIEESSGKILGAPEAVTTPSPYSGHLSFSRDGKRVAYAQILSKANLQHVRFDPKKESVIDQPVPVTQGSWWANTPDLSPDGEWLSFDSQGSQQDDVFVARRDGTGLRKLTDDIQRDRKPYWSPDGKRIVFFSNRSGKWEIWIVNADGSGLQQLTDTPEEVTNAVWSPDGSRLAYRNYSNSPSFIETGKSWREQSPQNLPAISELRDWFPWSWSRDGSKIAGFRVGPSGPEGVSVYSVESQGFEKVTDFGLRPVWLSDNRRILFQDLQTKLYILDTQSKKVRQILSAAPHELGNGVTISRDDRNIYLSLVTTESDIWLMSLE